MKFLPYSKENDKKITSDIIGYFASINKRHLIEWNVEIETPLWFSSASKKEYFIAKLRFLHFLKFSDLAEITNPEWYERNNKLPWNKRRFHHTEDYYNIVGGLDSSIATLRETYHRLYERNWVLDLRKRQKKRIKRQSKNNRKQPSLKKLHAAKASAAISTKIRLNKANELKEQIHKKACELLEKGKPNHTIASVLAKNYFHLSERQIRRHLLNASFKKTDAIKIKK